MSYLCWSLSDVSGSQVVFLAHHSSELKEEDFAHCVEQWRVEKEVVMRHWCEVSLKLTCKLGLILNPSLRRGVKVSNLLVKRGPLQATEEEGAIRV